MAVPRWYPSKIDSWLAVAMAIGPLMSVVALAGTLIAGDGVIFALGGVALFAAIYLGLVFPMRYGIDDEHIVIRHGLVRQRVPLRDITLVAPTRSPLGSPALSLDRIQIKYGEGIFKSALISPAAKAEFLEELAARANLRREGDRLVR
jgi:hypothetical protein